MPYKDPVERRNSAVLRKRRYRARLHEEKFGAGAGDQRGKHGNHVSGEYHYRWNSEKMISDHGYVKIRVGLSHPFSDGNGYAYEHLMVWALAGNPIPAPNEVIHHKNETKTDNRIENLEIKTRSEHGELHIAERERDFAGRLLEIRNRQNQFPEAK
jgi:HNH endonuclease